MLKKMRRKGWGKGEAAWLGVGALLVFGAIATFGYPSIRTSHTERVEQHVTTTKRVPATAGPTPAVRRSDITRTITVVRREVRTLRARVDRLRARARAEARRAAIVYCTAHDECRGGRGAKGDRGADGKNGMDGRDGRNAPPAHELDSEIVDGVDNRFRDLEAIVGDLVAKVDVLDRVVGLLCRILTPGRC